MNYTMHFPIKIDFIYRYYYLIYDYQFQLSYTFIHEILTIRLVIKVKPITI